MGVAKVEFYQSENFLCIRIGLLRAIKGMEEGGRGFAAGIDAMQMKCTFLNALSLFLIILNATHVFGEGNGNCDTPKVVLPGQELTLIGPEAAADMIQNRAGKKILGMRAPVTNPTTVPLRLADPRFDRMLNDFRRLGAFARTGPAAVYEGLLPESSQSPTGIGPRLKAGVTSPPVMERGALYVKIPDNVIAEPRVDFTHYGAELRPGTRVAQVSPVVMSHFEEVSQKLANQSNRTVILFAPDGTVKVFKPGTNSKMLALPLIDAKSGKALQSCGETGKVVGEKNYTPKGGKYLGKSLKGIAGNPLVTTPAAFYSEKYLGDSHPVLNGWIQFFTGGFLSPEFWHRYSIGDGDA